LPDPIVLSAGDGFRLEATAGELLDGKRVKLDLKLRRYRTRFERTADFFAGATMISREGADRQTSRFRAPDAQSIHPELEGERGRGRGK
jgi:hypothetical protein